MPKDGVSGMRILVTGGAGFIGSNLVHALIRDGASVRVLDSFLVGTGANPANLRDVEDTVDIIEGDTRDASALERAVDGAELVFHCAARTSHTLSMTSPLETFEVNSQGTLRLLAALGEVSPRPKLVHVGTTTQFGRMLGDSVDESHPEFPLDMYSATMVASEKFVLLFARAYGQRATVVRLCNTFGPRAAIRSADLGFVNYFIGLGLKGEPITIYGEGKQLRSLLFVDDAIDALVRAALADGSDGQVYVAGSQRRISVSEIAEAVAEHVGGSVTFVPWPSEREVIEVGDAVIDSSKIRSQLGWSASTELVDGLVTTREFYRPRLQHYL